MSTQSKLDDWLFLVGEWKGGGKLESVAGETATIEGTAIFTLELGG